MPRYFFNIDGERPYEDEVGSDYASDELAWREAIRTVRDLDDLAPGDGWRLKVKREIVPLYVLSVSSRRIDQTPDTAFDGRGVASKLFAERASGAST